MTTSEDAKLFKGSVTEKKLNKWKLTGLLEGLEDKEARKMAGLLENTAIWLLKLEDETELRNVSAVVLPIVRRVFQDLDYDVVPTPAYLHEDGSPKVVQIQDTGVKMRIPAEQDLTGHIDAEIEECQRVAAELRQFLQEKLDNGYDIVAYTPFIYDKTNAPGERSILFRGNFIK